MRVIMKTFKIINITNLSLACILFANGCTKQVEGPEQINPKNFVILLDLSDRITKEGVMETDKEIITEIFNLFVNQVRTNITINSRDKFKLRMLPQSSNAYSLVKYENHLSIDMESINIANKNIKIKEIEGKLDKSLEKLYKIAFKGSDKKDYSGTDIWKYFNEQLENDLEQNCENFVIVITDGYFDFEDHSHTLNKYNLYTSSIFYKYLAGSNWKQKAEKYGYGLMPCSFNAEFSTIVVGLNPKTNSLIELEKIQYFWIMWMNQSGKDCCTIPFCSSEKMISLLIKYLQIKY